jgi:hypothetical protein
MTAMGYLEVIFGEDGRLRWARCFEEGASKGREALG